MQEHRGELVETPTRVLWSVYWEDRSLVIPDGEVFTFVNIEEPDDPVRYQVRPVWHPFGGTQPPNPGFSWVEEV